MEIKSIATAMSPSEIMEIMKEKLFMKYTSNMMELCYMLWGAPGVGKSMLIKDLAEELKVRLIDIRAVYLDPVDLRGIPVPMIEARKTIWLTPDMWPTKGKGIIFLDELPQGAQSVQNGLSELILDGKLGEYEKPPGWKIIAAGNRQTDRAATTRMPSHIANRFLHIEFGVNVDNWLQWAFKNHIRPEVSTFIKYRPDLLHNFDPQADDKAFPSPRTWHAVSSHMQGKLTDNLQFKMNAGFIGKGAATEFAGFLRIWKSLVKPEDIINSPGTVDVPSDPGVLYALCGALANVANRKNMAPIIKFCGRLSGEFQVLMMSLITTRDRNLMKTSAFIDWSMANSDVVFGSRMD